MVFAVNRYSFYLACFACFVYDVGMEKETITTSQFRQNIGSLFRSVFVGKKELIVTWYGKPSFKVTQVPNDFKTTVQISSTEARNDFSEFAELFADSEFVVLTKFHQKILCTRL